MSSNIVFNLLVTLALLSLSSGANAFGQRADIEPLYNDVGQTLNATASTTANTSASRTKAFVFPQAILSQENNVRSRSDVIREVKQRYRAEVLRIKLNRKRMVYEVRVLMPNGKVKNITISAGR